MTVLAVIAALAFAGFFALGTWQVERRAWKLDLIERVEARIHAAPVPAPGPARWPLVTAAADEYRRVAVTGTFLHDKETLVQATTDLGGGFWVLTPLRRNDGTVVLVNRGFVPPDFRERSTRADNEPAGETAVVGLLRMPEPGGAFLRQNDPAAGRWYSRDVQAIAAAHGLGTVAPYFIDADAAPGTAGAGAVVSEDGGRRTPAAGALPSAVPANGTTGSWPQGGLTVVRFNNNHLVYALTWYGLALMVAAAAWYVGREESRRRRRQ
nr:SURF1 family protein [Cupriavidus sp. AU9028]